MDRPRSAVPARLKRDLSGEDLVLRAINEVAVPLQWSQIHAHSSSMWMTSSLPVTQKKTAQKAQRPSTAPVKLGIPNLMEEGTHLPTTGPISQFPPHQREERTRAREKESLHQFAIALEKKGGLQEFLGAAGVCCIWIPGFSAIRRPLYDLSGGPN